MSRARIAVIEDDAGIRVGIVAALRAAGFSSLPASDPVGGLAAASADGVDLVLLDIMLAPAPATAATPDSALSDNAHDLRDGFDVLRELRRVRPTRPVICVTARGEPEERVRGLDLGADDYVVKPFGVAELLARINAVLRRSAERRRPTARLAVAGRSVDLDASSVVTPSGERRDLPPRERDVLAYLASSRGEPVTREELFRRVWGVEARGRSMRAVDMAIARLRDLLDDDAAKPTVIRTVRGRGYMLLEDDA